MALLQITFSQAVTPRCKLISCPRLDFGDACVGSKGVVDEDADAVGGDGGEGNLAPDEVVAADVATRYIGPCGTGPVLDLKGGDAVEAEGHRSGWFAGGRVVILEGEDIDFADGFGTGKSDLNPARIGYR